MSHGWKSYLGAIGKGIAGAAGTVLIGSLPNLPVDPTTAHGGILAAVAYFVFGAIEGIGKAHKAERQIEATKAIE